MQGVLCSFAVLERTRNPSETWWKIFVKAVRVVVMRDDVTLLADVKGAVEKAPSPVGGVIFCYGCSREFLLHFPTKNC